MGPQLPLVQTLELLITERNRLRRSRWASNTERGYGYDWAAFCRWCEQLGRSSLPASSETLSLYLAGLFSRGLKVSTATRHASSVAHFHRLNGHPCPNTPEIRELLNAAQRIRGEKPRQMRALGVTELRSIADLLVRDGGPLAIRNCAMLVLGFASALRRCNLVALALEDVDFDSHGLVLHIGREKQDQAGRGRMIGVPFGAHPETCPVTRLKAWLEIRGTAPGPLFTHIGSLAPLKSNRVLAAVKSGVTRINLDPTEYGAHSLRAGFVTSAGEAGAGELVIASQTGHRSMSVLRRYFRHSDLWRANACNMIGL